MGGSSWNSAQYQQSSQQKQSQTRAQVMSTNLDPEMNPKGVKLRESRDSDAHPTSDAIMVGLDVTGSMGEVPEKLIKGKLKEVMDTLIAHGVEHPQILFAAIGDHHCDKAPFQVSQYESGNIELEKWLSKIWPEGGGGGNGGESYLLAWYFAARFTSIDCFEKRGQKGFIFTIGDEEIHPTVDAASLSAIFGEGSDIDAATILSELERTYHVFHISIGSPYPRWESLLGERVLRIDDPEIVAELIASTVAVVRGAEITKVVSGFDSNTAAKLTTALATVKSSVATTGGSRSTAL